MSRAKRKRNRTIEDLRLGDMGGLMGMLDDEVRATYYLTPEEMEHISEFITEEEVDELFKEEESYSINKRRLEIVEKYMSIFK